GGGAAAPARPPTGRRWAGRRCAPRRRSAGPARPSARAAWTCRCPTARARPRTCRRGWSGRRRRRSSARPRPSARPGPGGSARRRGPARRGGAARTRAVLPPRPRPARFTRQSWQSSLEGRGSDGRQSRHFLLDATLALLVLIPWLLGAAACQRTEGGAAPAPAAGPGATPVAGPQTAAPSPLPAAPPPGAKPAAAPRTAVPSPLPAAPAPVVVFLGDSLTAGLGLPADQAYPALLARELAGDGFAVRVINAGVSGDTTAGGLRRLRWLLAQHPAVVVVGLGGNDALRGQPPAEIERNLREIVTQARQ